MFLSLLVGFLVAVDSTPHFVVLDSGVRARLAIEWDAINPRQVERGYCVAYVEDKQWGVPVYRVWAIERAKEFGATPHSVLATCPDGKQVAFLHTHPPTTCEVSWDCKIGGDDAYQCLASEIDQSSLNTSGDAFWLVQCDRNAIVIVWPKKKERTQLAVRSLLREREVVIKEAAPAKDRRP